MHPTWDIKRSLKMKCPNLSGLEFSKKNLEYLDKARELTRHTDQLTKALSFGSLAAIFVGNGALVAQFNISNTDFALMAESLSSVSKIKRYELQKISYSAYRNSSSYKEREFWKAMINGCKND